MNRSKMMLLSLGILVCGSSVYIFGLVSRRRRKMQITSEAFQYGGRLPARYTCDAESPDPHSPPLTFMNVPQDTKSLVILAENPESEIGHYYVWVVFNLPPTITELPEDADIKALGGIVGTTTDNKIGFYGICPGELLRSYYFHLYALDTKLDLDSSAHAELVLEKMKGHILAQSDLMAKYKRTRPIVPTRLQK